MTSMDPLAAAVDAADRAANEAKLTRESVDAQRAERARNTKWARIAAGVGLVMILGNTASNVQQSRAAGQLKRQAKVQEAAREQSREILRTLLAYADPESEVGKTQAAKSAAFVNDMVMRFADEVRKGTSATAAVGWCRSTEVGNEGYVACLAQFGITLPPVVTPAP